MLSSRFCSLRDKDPETGVVVVAAAAAVVVFCCFAKTRSTD